MLTFECRGVKGKLSDSYLRHARPMPQAKVRYSIHVDDCNMVHVDVHAAEKYAYEFQLDTREYADRYPAMLHVLAMVVSSYAQLFQSDASELPLPEVVSPVKLEASASAVMTCFFRHYYTQSKLMNFWRFCKTQPENYAWLLSDSLANTPLNDSPMPMKPMKRPLVSMSYGKESLLTAALLEASDINYSIGVIDYTETRTIQDPRLAGFMEAYRGLTRKYLYEHPRVQASVVKTNTFKENNTKIDLELLQFHQQLYACLHFLNTGVDTVLFGDEWERSLSEEMLINDQKLAVHTFDFSQSTQMHALWNRMMAALEIPLQIGSVLHNICEPQVQALAAKLIPNFDDIQTSCWFSKPEKPWCGHCSKCQRIAALNRMLGRPGPHELWQIEVPRIEMPEHAAKLFAVETEKPVLQMQLYNNYVHWHTLKSKPKMDWLHPQELWDANPVRDTLQSLLETL